MNTDVLQSGAGCWSLDEVAEFLAVSPSTIRRKITHGSVYFDSTFPQPKRVGKLIRFIIAEILEWARNR